MSVLIGVISDTHIPARAKKIPSKVIELFEDVDIILHAGDLVSMNVISELEKIAKVYVVRGNMDNIRELPKQLIIEAEQIRIGLTHGDGAPRGLGEKLLSNFENIDCLVYGHSHKADNRRYEGVLLFNPGSPTDNYFAPYRSVGFLYVDDKKIKGEIIKID